MHVLADIRRTLRATLSGLSDLFLPRRCELCGGTLVGKERMVCGVCLSQLPRTEMRGEKGNVVERLLWGRVAVVRASAFLFHYPHTRNAVTVYAPKYDGKPELAVYLGEMMAEDLAGTSFFDGVDSIVPVPLFPKREKQRGFNQSERLAEGVSRVTGLPVLPHALRRTTETVSQTLFGKEERERNIRKAFSLSPGAEKTLAGRHVLLIDDVVTFGGTLAACAAALSAVPGVRVSVLALAVSHSQRKRDFPHDTAHVRDVTSETEQT